MSQSCVSHANKTCNLTFCESMHKFSAESLDEIKTVDFGCVPVDTAVEKYLYITNIDDKPLTYRISLTYIMNNIDRVFKPFVSSSPVTPGENIEIKIMFKPQVPRQSYTEYYIVDDTAGNTYRLTVTGSCFGPVVTLSKKKLVFRILKNVSEPRKSEVSIINKSAIDAIYQWIMPFNGQGYFQISTGTCGVLRAFETITVTVIFNGMALGIYIAELVCLVLNQEPLFLNAMASVVLPENTLFNINDHVLNKNLQRKFPSVHLMENSLNLLGYIPSASVFERYLDFGTGSVKDVTRNISQTLCVTNHEQEEGYIQWLPDRNNIFMIDPIACAIPSNESRLFTVRFRPKTDNEVYGYVMCGDYQCKRFYDEKVSKLKHTWFRIPCIGNTWSPCTEWTTEWDCPVEVTLPPTVPARTTFTNFLLSNKLDIPMYFKFEAPDGNNFVVLPMCGIVQSRGWQVITVALEPKTFGDYYETWDLMINKVQKARISLSGNAEVSEVEVMSHGYSPAAHAMYEFPPTITGCTNYCTAYLHNLTRMFIHMRVLSNVSWLGADNCGSLVIPPKEIIRYHWWFFPKTPDLVYDTTITCSCVCLVDGRPIGEPTEIFIHIFGFSELPDLRVLPKLNNLHDVVVGDSESCSVTLYNYGSCYFTSKLYSIIEGMGDDHSGDRLEIDSPVNSLKPSNHCQITFTITPDGAGPRQINIKYTVLFRTEFDEIEEIQPIKKKICVIWYDGIYPTIKIKRTISVKCPVILSNHCVWNLTNVDNFNKALEDCRPNKPLSVDIYAPDLCLRAGNVQFIFVMGCVYDVPVPWNLRREKICNCEMIEVQIGISTYEMRHTCTHRQLVELTPLSGIVSPDNPGSLYFTFYYAMEQLNTLCYVMTMPNDRSIYIYVRIFAHFISKGILTPLRRPIKETEYLAATDCGTVPINNLDPVIRLVWLYNPTDVFTTWRLLRGNTITPDSVIRCLLYFAEVPPLGRLSIPFAFMPTEMIAYEVVFFCSFGYDTEKILIKGQGGVPNCIESRMDMPIYVERIIRSVYRTDVVYLSTEHITLWPMPTHSLTRDVVAICNDTDHIIRFIWLPERIANIINVVMTPCWGIIQPKSCEWITMTVYTLQEPSTLTTVIACEILDLTERRRYQRNELLRRNKVDKCNQEFIITEEGLFHPNINDSPPYVLDLEKPQPIYLALTVSVASKGQRDGFPRMLLRQMWEKTPPYDLLSTEIHEQGGPAAAVAAAGNNMTMNDMIRVIDGILWDSLHSKMFKNQIQFYAKEDIPTYDQIIKVTAKDAKSRLSRRVTSGICDAIVNKAVFHAFGLNPKHDASSILECE